MSFYLFERGSFMGFRQSYFPGIVVLKYCVMVNVSVYDYYFDLFNNNGMRMVSSLGMIEDNFRGLVIHHLIDKLILDQNILD